MHLIGAGRLAPVLFYMDLYAFKNSIKNLQSNIKFDTTYADIYLERVKCAHIHFDSEWRYSFLL